MIVLIRIYDACSLLVFVVYKNNNPTQRTAYHNEDHSLELEQYRTRPINKQIFKGTVQSHDIPFCPLIEYITRMQIFPLVVPDKGVISI